LLLLRHIAFDAPHMKASKLGLVLGILFILCGAFAVYWVLISEHTVVLHPKGTVAESELSLIQTNVLLMLIIIIPTFIAFLWTAWKYHKKPQTKETSQEKVHEIIFWIPPAIIVAVMATITWDATHKLDPFAPLESEKKPLTIQVVALDWKWLFIYPEQDIATVNFVQFPDNTPIRFALCADSSPMNSFWIPQLSGQIYSMTGMKTVLHMMASGPGEYAGKAVEINGEGYAGMTFTAKSTSQRDFDSWVQSIKKLPAHLDSAAYTALVVPSTDHPVVLYGHVEKELFDKILVKFDARS
jgi:cytochrome o ubiquinol oxidase subunit 2